MKKNMFFLSAALTTFILAVLASVVLKARASVSLSPTDVVVPVKTLAQASTQTLQPTIAEFISPEEAVFIASSALGNEQVYSVDTETRYGLDVYKVTFSSGSVVFVSPQGHILTITALEPIVIAPNPNQQPSDHQSGNQELSNQQSVNQQSDGQQTFVENPPVPTNPPVQDSEHENESPEGDD
jgi:hypothetical protein